MINQAQRNTLKLTAIIFLLSCIFVPYKFGYETTSHSKSVDIGYYLIYETPRYKGDNSMLNTYGSASIDFQRLIVNWIAIGGFFGLVYYNRKEE